MFCHFIFFIPTYIRPGAGHYEMIVGETWDLVDDVLLWPGSITGYL